jgi:hypothetical protein
MEVDGTTRKWPYMDITTQQEVRGILVARILVAGRPVYILEVQRRSRKRKDACGNMEEAEESFKGLAFALDDRCDFLVWLNKFLSDVRHVKGVVEKISGTCPGSPAVFKHRPAKDDNVPCEAAVMNALRKIGVHISLMMVFIIYNLN